MEQEHASEALRWVPVAVDFWLVLALMFALAIGLVGGFWMHGCLDSARQMKCYEAGVRAGKKEVGRE